MSVTNFQNIKTIKIRVIQKALFKKSKNFKVGKIN